jgi:hypothetical protein
MQCFFATPEGWLMSNTFGVDEKSLFSIPEEDPFLSSEQYALDHQLESW